MKYSLVLSIIQFLLVLLFLYTGLSKLMNTKGLYDALQAVPFVKTYATLLSITLPVLEILIAILIIVPSTSKKALFGSLSLLSLFTIYLLWMVLTQKDLPCSCGGVIQQMTWKQHIHFNIVFITINVVAILIETSRKDRIAIKRLEVQQAS